MVGRIETVEIYNEVDWDYPTCGGNIIRQVVGKPIYTIEHLSNMSGQRSGSIIQIELSREVDVDDEVYETVTGAVCTIADCLINNEIGAYGRDYLKSLDVVIVNETTIRRGHIIR